MKMLITGGTGFIGKHLIEKLTVGATEAVLHIEKLDIFDRRQDLAHTVSIGDYDTIIHLAANPLIKNNDTDSLYRSNVKLTLDIVQNCKKSCHVVFASSAAVYGDYFDATEESPTIPSSPYGFSKLASENLIQMYGIKHTILRLCANVGPNNTHGVLKDLIYKYNHNHILEVIGAYPGSTKPFTHINDTVRCIQHVLANDITGVYNIGNEEPVAVNQIVEEIESFYRQNKAVSWLGESANWKGDNKKVYIDSSLIKHTGFEYKYPTSLEAIRATIRG